MTRIFRRAAKATLRITMEFLPLMVISIIALVEPASSGERIASAAAICLVASMWAASKYAEAQAEADKEMAKFAVGLLSRLTNGDSTELNVNITHRTDAAKISDGA